MRHKTDKVLKSRARDLRTNQTATEQKLWALLRAHRFADVKFTRQVVVSPYIVDFAARSRRLAIEIDGDTHGHRLQYDAARTEFLERQGYRVIRFTNGEVTGNIEGVAAAIAEALASTPLPGPLPDGEREA